MKIFIPADDESIKGDVSQSFGRAPYYCIYDTETKESSFINNSAADSPGGAGIKAAQILVDNKTVDGKEDIVITPRCGQNAAEVLIGADIKLYKSIEDSIENNIKAFNDGKLVLLEEIHSGHHNSGGR